MVIRSGYFRSDGAARGLKTRWKLMCDRCPRRQGVGSV